MKKIGFIGAYDKLNMLLNVSKILTAFNKRVLIVDFTANQKARYIVPAINPTISYVTTYEDIDVAVGFKEIDDIKVYLGSQDELPYDIILFDLDIPSRIEKVDLTTTDKNYFVTAFDLYSLKRGMEILRVLKEPVKMTKILYAYSMTKEENDYLNYISLDYKIEWDEQRIYFPIENGDLIILAENERVQKIKLKKLSVQYKDGLINIVSNILENESESNIRKVIKSIERGV